MDFPADIPADFPAQAHPHPHGGWPGNELEEVLSASLGVPAAAGRLIEVLGRSFLWIPLPEGGGPTPPVPPNEKGRKAPGATEHEGGAPKVEPWPEGTIIPGPKEKPFTRPEELMEVKGIGEKLFLTLKPYVTVSGPTTLNAKVRSSASSPRRSAAASLRRSPRPAMARGRSSSRRYGTP